MSTAHSTVSARLLDFAQRLGLRRVVAPEFRQRIAQLALTFPRLPVPEDTIWWHNALSLESLYELPRGALSGPVQDDKAHAHKALRALIYRQQWEIDALDLRSISGLVGYESLFSSLTQLEHYNVAQCRHIRIISMTDLSKVLDNLQTDRWVLNEASWRGGRRFWTHSLHNQAITAAVCYAKLRKLCVERPAVINSFQFNHDGIQKLSQQFHVLYMPNEAWNNEALMDLLATHQLPYSRLSLDRATRTGDCLILPKQHAYADALGQGLLALGAEDFCDYLRRLPQ